jgi:large repetitive protein
VRNLNLGDESFWPSQSGTTAITIAQAAPTFSGLTGSQIIAYSTATIDVSGTLSSPTASPVGQDVTITINGAATTAEVGADGSFTATIDTATLPASATPYTIAYGYAGDGNFQSASGTTSLTASEATPVITWSAPAGITLAGFGSGGTGWTTPTNTTGNPIITGDVLTLTNGGGGEASAAWFNTPVSTTGSFMTSFTYTDQGGGGGDGIAFVLQNDPRGTAALGGAGGALGYGGSSSIQQSVAYEINVYNGDTQGTNFVTNGSTGTYNATGAVNVASGDPIKVTLAYDAAAETLTEFLFDATTGSSYTHTYTGIDLSSTLGGSTAILGFTGGTGGSTSTQTIGSFGSTPGLTYGMALPATQLNATSPVAGSFVYSPAAGTVLGAGPHLISISFTPTDQSDYKSTTASVLINVQQAAPTFSDLTESQTITYGAATIDVSGMLSSPTANPLGQDVTITINGAATTAEVGADGSFTATIDTATLPATATPYTIAYGYAGDGNFQAASDSTTTLTVNKATPVITWSDPADITYGTALGDTQLNATVTGTARRPRGR